jgi:hypothetical protein
MSAALESQPFWNLAGRFLACWLVPKVATRQPEILRLPQSPVPEKVRNIVRPGRFPAHTGSFRLRLEDQLPNRPIELPAGNDPSAPANERDGLSQRRW